MIFDSFPIFPLVVFITLYGTKFILVHVLQVCATVRLRGRNCLYLFYVRITVYVMCSFLFGLVFTAREEIRDLRVETGRGCCVRFLSTWGQPREIFLGSLRCLVLSE